MAASRGVAFTVIGRVGGETARISAAGRTLVELPLDSLRREWRLAFARELAS
jgi:hypothetical protein